MSRQHTDKLTFFGPTESALSHWPSHLLRWLPTYAPSLQADKKSSYSIALHPERKAKLRVKKIPLLRSSLDAVVTASSFKVQLQYFSGALSFRKIETSSSV